MKNETLLLLLSSLIVSSVIPNMAHAHVYAEANETALERRWKGECLKRPNLKACFQSKMEGLQKHCESIKESKTRHSCLISVARWAFFYGPKHLDLELDTGWPVTLSADLISTEGGTLHWLGGRTEAEKESKECLKNGDAFHVLHCLTAIQAWVQSPGERGEYDPRFDKSLDQKILKYARLASDQTMKIKNVRERNNRLVDLSNWWHKIGISIIERPYSKPFVLMTPVHHNLEQMKIAERILIGEPQDLAMIVLYSILVLDNERDQMEKGVVRDFSKKAYLFLEKFEPKNQDSFDFYLRGYFSVLNQVIKSSDYGLEGPEGSKPYYFEKASRYLKKAFVLFRKQLKAWSIKSPLKGGRVDADFVDWLATKVGMMSQFQTDIRYYSVPENRALGKLQDRPKREAEKGEKTRFTYISVKARFEKLVQTQGTHSSKKLMEDALLILNQIQFD